MNVSRHIAKDMRSALGMVREIHGPDAVILSNRKVPEGIEITATADYDESSVETAQVAPVKYSFPSLEDETPAEESQTNTIQERLPATAKETLEGDTGKEQPLIIELISEEEIMQEKLQRRQKAAESLALSIKEDSAIHRLEEEQAASEISKLKPQINSESEFTVELSRAARNLSKSNQVSASGQEQAPVLQDVGQEDFFDHSMSSLLNPAISMDDLPEPLDNRHTQQVKPSGSDVEQAKSNQPNSISKPSQDISQSTKKAELLWTSDSMLDEMRKELSSLRSLVETQISGFAWGEINRRNPVKAGIMRQLVALGLNSAMAKRLSDQIPEELGHRKAWFRALAMFANQIPVAGDTILTQGGIVTLVGPPGVGKTTIIAKLAVQYALRHGRENVALITTDASRFGAFDQIRNLGSILKMPVRAVGSGPELEAALDSFSDRRLVLIDTAGLGHRDERLLKTLETIKGSSQQLKAYLVMSASTQAESIEQMMMAFKPVEPYGCIISKVDESSSLGPILSAIAQHKLPVSYYSEGQKIPDDLKIAEVQELVGKAVAISKSMNAFEKTEDVMIEQMLMGEKK